MTHFQEMLGRSDTALEAVLTVSSLLRTEYSKEAMASSPDLVNALLRMLCPTAMYSFDCRVASVQALAMIANVLVGAATISASDSYVNIKNWLGDLDKIAPSQPDLEWFRHFAALFVHCL